MYRLLRIEVLTIAAVLLIAGVAAVFPKASEESGYSYSALQQMHSKGNLTSVGEHGRPRIRRRDLPFKPSRPGLRLVDGQPNVAEEILASKLADT